jgi:hypothetical protein
MSVVQNPLALPGDDAQIIAARRRLLLEPLSVPANGLLYSSLFSILVFPGNAAQLVLFLSNPNDQSANSVIESWEKYWHIFVPTILIHFVIIYSAWQMRRGRQYPICIAGSILALLPLPVTWVAGVIFGIWALVLLRTKDMQQVFTTQPKTAQ